MWKTVAIPWKQLLSDKDVSREFKRIPLRQIRKNPNQPRKLFDVQALQELADSVRQVGIITPLTVRRLEEGYELIAGAAAAGRRHGRAEHRPLLHRGGGRAHERPHGSGGKSSAGRSVLL